jgi:hypothetical protein
MGVHVSREEWDRIAEEDLARRAGFRERDLRGSVLTAVAGLLMITMLVVGPMWTLIAVVGGPDEHSKSFDGYWWLTTVLIAAAAVPLAAAIRRERSGGRWGLTGLLVASLAIQLATYPW